MEAISELGIAIILFLQSLGEWLLVPMRSITFLGNEQFYLFVAPAVYWCWDASLGLRFGLYFVLSGSLNNILKLAFHTPRPYWVNARVRAYYTETSFGIPSGHSQNAVVVWGTLADGLKRRWAWIVAGVLIFLIGLSRMYLGVHFPIDVLSGWVVGALLLWALLRWEKPFIAWLNRRHATEQILLALGVSLVLILVGASIRLAMASWQAPASWAQAAAQAAPEAETIAPLSLSGLITTAAFFFGFALGGILLRESGGFDAGGPAWKRLLRFLIGVIGVFAIWYGLGEVFPDGENLAAYGLRYVRYVLVGLWVAFLGPVIFIRLRLAEKQSAGGVNAR